MTRHSLQSPVPKGTSLADKLEYWSIPEPNSGCVLWLGGLFTHNGYGAVAQAGKNLKAHRASYELTFGPVPDGMVLDHLCRVRSCINPDHLEVVTQRENVHRGRLVDLSETCIRGHAFTRENTRIYTRKDGRAHRQCVQCIRIRTANNRRVA